MGELYEKLIITQNHYKKEVSGTHKYCESISPAHMTLRLGWNNKPSDDLGNMKDKNNLAWKRQIYTTYTRTFQIISYNWSRFPNIYLKKGWRVFFPIIMSNDLTLDTCNSVYRIKITHSKPIQWKAKDHDCWTDGKAHLTHFKAKTLTQRSSCWKDTRERLSASKTAPEKPAPASRCFL